MADLNTPPVYRYRSACAACKARKVRCDREKPCSSCIRSRRQSTCYATETSTSASISRLADLGADLEAERTVKKQKRSGSHIEHSKYKDTLPVLILPKKIVTIASERPAYLDELPPPSTCLESCSVLIYVYWDRIAIDRHQATLIWNDIIEGKASRLQRAYLCSLLALAGDCAPPQDCGMSADKVCSREAQKRHFAMANQLLVPAASEPTTHWLVAQTQLHLATYLYCRHEFDEALNYLRTCICSAWETEFFPATTTAAPMMEEASSESNRQTKPASLKFRINVYFMDIWLSYLSGNALLVASEARLEQELASLKELASSPAEDKDWLEYVTLTLRALYLALKVERLKKSGLLCISEDGRFSEVTQSVDNALVSCLNSPMLTRLNLQELEARMVEDGKSARLMSKTIGIRNLVNQLRCSVLASATAKWSNAPSLQTIALRSSYDTLQCLPHCVKLIRSKYNKFYLPCPRDSCRGCSKDSFLNCPRDTCLETSMRVFCQALQESFDMQRMLPKAPLLGSNTEIETFNGFILKNLVIKFDAIFNMLNFLGEITPATVVCATMIKQAPIHQLPTMENISPYAFLNTQNNQAQAQIEYQTNLEDTLASCASSSSSSCGTLYNYKEEGEEVESGASSLVDEAYYTSDLSSMVDNQLDTIPNYQGEADWTDVNTWHTVSTILQMPWLDNVVLQEPTKQQSLEALLYPLYT